MKKFYYQIKGKCGVGENNLFGSVWQFPPLYSNIVEAESKVEAKKIIDEEYGRVFPLRVLNKDLESNEFLLSIEEASEYQLKLFEDNECSYCKNKFRVIDLYNNHNESYKGRVYCSYTCSKDDSDLRRMIYDDNNTLNGSSLPVIYKITNKKSGMIYIGKTTQVFTLRWYQHFFQHTGTKFHEAIKSSEYSDWLFEIIEIIRFPEELEKNKKVYEDYIFERERHYINHFNSINEGYNSL